MTDDIRADIEAAMKGEPEEATSEVVEAPEKVEPQQAEAEPKEAPKPEPDESKSDANARDDKGRFAKKADDVTQDQGQPSVEGQDAPSQEAHRAPMSWSPEAKAAFATLPDAVKAAIAKRETEVDDGFRKKGESLKRYEPLDNVIAPYREKWSMRGIDEATAVKQLLAASDWLERNPREALGYLAQQYGVSLGQQAQGQPGVQSPQQAQPHPQVQTLQQQIQQLESQFRQQTEAQEQARKAELLSQIEAFRNDPANVYFDNVRPHMGALLNSGQAKDLQDAYDQAVWANPETRALLIKDQEAKRQKEAQTKAKEKAETARKAGASVTGAPGLGKSVALNGAANNSIRDDILQAYEGLQGRA